MNQSYKQEKEAVEQNVPAEGEGVYDAAGSATGAPLAGKDRQESVKKSKARKAASAFRTISEVADILNVQQHVLRFWETKFSQIRPLKRGGGRRYYRPEDLELLKKIHHLLYTEGYTIKGVQKLLREKGKAVILQESRAPQNNNEPKAPAVKTVQGQVSVGMSARQRSALQTVLMELKELRELIKSE